MLNRQALFLSTTLLAVWNAALIWMTQVICYPLWAFVGRSEFHDYHLAWWHRIWWTFVAAGLALIGSIVLLFRRPSYVSQRTVTTAAVAQVISLIVTLVFWAPLQAGLSTAQGLDLHGFATLMWTHWFRVALIWIPAVVLTAALAQRMLRLED